MVTTIKFMVFISQALLNCLLSLLQFLFLFSSIRQSYASNQMESVFVWALLLVLVILVDW